jgi:hypothetical protein
MVIVAIYRHRDMRFIEFKNEGKDRSCNDSHESKAQET